MATTLPQYSVPWWMVGTPQVGGGDTADYYTYGGQELELLQRAGLTPQQAQQMGLTIGAGPVGNQHMSQLYDAQGNPVGDPRYGNLSDPTGMLKQFGLGTLGMVGAIGALGLPLTGAAAGGAATGGAAAGGTGAAGGATAGTVGAGGAAAGGAAAGGAAGSAGGLFGSALSGAGNMPWGSIIGGGLNLAGGYLGAKGAEDAAKTTADSQLEAARLAAEESRFRPIGVTNAFGSSNFTFDQNGRLSGAGYTVDPRLAALRDQLLGSASYNPSSSAVSRYGQGVQDNLFSYGSAMLGQLPLANERLRQFTGPQDMRAQAEADAQDIVNRQQRLLAPGRERSMAQLQNSSYQQGRSGLAVGGTSGMFGSNALRQANPEMEAFANAQMQQDMQIANSATDLARQRIADEQRYRVGEQGIYGTDIARPFGMFDMAMGGVGQLNNAQLQAQNLQLAPLLAQLQAAGGIEEMGQGAFNLGTALGGRVANPSGGQMLLSGANNAAMSNLAGMNTRNNFYQNLFGQLGNWGQSAYDWWNQPSSNYAPPVPGRPRGGA